MTYKRATLSFHSIAPDLIAQDAPGDVWNSGRNVIFRNGETLRAPGDGPTLPGASLTPRTCRYVVSGVNGFWVYANETGIYAHDGTVESDITPAGWSTAYNEKTVFTSCVLGGIVYVNASDRDPVYWDGNTSNPCQVLPDWPVDGRTIALRAHKNFLFAIGFISEGGERVRWSDAAEPGSVPQSWTPASDNLAGFLDLAPLFSNCVEGETLRDSFLIYKNESIWALDFVGGNIVFQARKLFAEHGIAGTNAVTRGLDDVHLFIGDEGDVFLTDGVRVNSVLDGRIQRTFYADFSAAQNRIFAAATLSREKLGFLMYPASGSASADRALVYDFPSGDIGLRDMPDVFCAASGAKLTDIGDVNTWDGDDGEWDSDGESWPTEVVNVSLDDLIVGGSGGFASVSDAGASDFLSGPISARVEKAGLAFGNPQARKMISRVWPKVTGTPGDVLSFRFGGQEVTGGPVTLAPAIDFVIGQNESLDLFAQGRFMSLEVSSQGGNIWRLGSIDFEYREVGSW